METLLQDLVVNNFFAFLLIFMRIGVALMIMPGIGDNFVTPQIRLLFALAISFVLAPFLMPNLPPLPAGNADLLALLLSEAFIGMFVGMVMRILISALDTAGAVASVQSGLSNAILFNPVTAGQGTILGAMYSALGVTLLFVTNMDHYMLATVVESYSLFPATGRWIDAGAALEAISQTVNIAFRVGVQMAIPFLIVGMILQFCFGLLGRLMPQIQVFFLALPAQIILSLIVMALCLSAGITFWLSAFDGVVTSALTVK